MPKPKRQTKRKGPEPEKTRFQILSECIGTLAGLDQQLGRATWDTELVDRVAFLLKFGTPDISSDDLKTLETLTLWTERTRKAIGQFRVKLAEMKPPLFPAAREAREESYGH